MTRILDPASSPSADVKKWPEHNRVVQVTGNLRALVDNTVELVRFAATLTGLRPAVRAARHRDTPVAWEGACPPST
jgi:hypothetical protein